MKNEEKSMPSRLAIDITNAEGKANFADAISSIA